MELEAWLRVHPEVLPLAIALFVAGGLISYVAFMRKWLREPNKMSAGHRREVQSVADGIVEGLEEQVYQGFLSRHAANQYYRRFAKILELDDLVRQPNKHQLKRMIQTRRSKINGNHKPMPLPGDELPPWEDKPQAQDTSLAGILARHTR